MTEKLSIVNLQVEFCTEPLDVETQTPRFHWQIIGQKTEEAILDCQIRVYEADILMWDSGKIQADFHSGITYEGKPLNPCTRYTVQAIVWDSAGESAQAETFFETAFLDGSEKPWEGAQWISAAECNLYAQSKEVFSIETQMRIAEGTCGGIVFGANDPRLLDKNLNLFGMAGPHYFAYELDISAVPAQLKIYRVGYTPGDSPEIPLAMVPVPGISPDRLRDFHTLRVDVLGNQAQTFLDGECIDWGDQPAYSITTGRQLNILGRSDVIAFPLLCEIGFCAEKETRTEYQSLIVRNLRTPKAVLFEEKPGNPRIFREKPELTVQDGCFALYSQNGRTITTADPSHSSMPIFRQQFQVGEKLKKARLFMTARGIYEGSMNGTPLSEEWFLPGLDQYDKHLGYQVYNVTDKLVLGENTLLVQLGSGWWSDSQTYTIMNHNYFGDRPSLLAKLVLEYEDDRKEVLVSSPENWQYYENGPVVYAGNFHGETFDARKEGIFDPDGWKTPIVSEAVPIPETEQAPPWPAPNHTVPVLTAQNNSGAKVVQTLTAKAVSEPRPGIFVYDMGQNMAGVPRIRLREKAGTLILMRYGEMLYPQGDASGMEGMLLTENLRDAICTDRYYCRGDADGETFEPHFTFHGYRYIEITGCSQPPALEDVQGLAISSAVRLTGDFTCSEPLINRLFENVRWSQYANSISVPTDCPQRNERLGWMGDAQVFARTACFNADMHRFYRRFLRAARDLQTPEGQYPNVAPVGGGFGGIAWESAGIIVTWEVYRHYGDLEIIRENYSAMQRYLDFLIEKGWPGILTDVGPLGDWLATDMETDQELIWNAIFAYDAKILGQMAEAIGKKEDALRYQALFEEIRNLWNQVFVDEEGYTRRRDGTRNDTQCSYALPLGYGIFSDAHRSNAALRLAQRVRRDHHTVTCGFLGTPHLNPALCENGYADDAYQLLLQTQYPSWLYPILQGATTIWERWNSYTVENGFGGNNSMNSFNHYSLGAVASWIYEYVLGIRQEPDSAGYQNIRIQPVIQTFTYASGYYDSIAGRISVDWKKEGDHYLLQVQVPAEVKASVVLPAEKVFSGEGKETTSKGCFRCFEIAGGSHLFRLKV